MKPAQWPEFVYLTRDRDEETGLLSDVIEVWASPPNLEVGERGALWITPNPDDTLLGRYPIADLGKLRTLPDTERECVRLPIR